MDSTNKQSGTLRLQVDPNAIKQSADKDTIQTQAEPNSRDGYMPLLRIPNKLRRMYGYRVYHKTAGSAF